MNRQNTRYENTDIIEESNTTLRRIEQHDPQLTSLAIVNRDSTGDYTTRGQFWLHDEADLMRLGNSIANNTHLKEIALYNTLEWTVDARSLFEGLQRSTTIKLLSLHGNTPTTIHDTRHGGIGIGILNEFVANSSSVTGITIHRCDLRGGVARALSQTITKCPTLNKFMTISCDIDNASLKEIVSGIKGLSSLQILNILNYSLTSDNNNIGIEGAEAIQNLLQDPGCNLTDLRLYRSGFNSECIQIIVDSLIGNTKLEHLQLSACSIGKSSCESIVTLLQDPSCNINHLNLSDCDISNESVTKIIRSLIGNTKLKQFDLYNNNIGRSGCESIATLLADPNSNIRSINLTNCQIDDDYAALLARSLIGNTKLKILGLFRSRITETGWNAFSSVLLNGNHTLCNLGKNYDGKDFVSDNLASLLKINLALDMEPLLELDK